jgi:hypothetical protein
MTTQSRKSQVFGNHNQGRSRLASSLYGGGMQHAERGEAGTGKSLQTTKQCVQPALEEFWRILKAHNCTHDAL